MILVCGEALVDLVPNGRNGSRATPGGGPFNTARALARLEIPTAFLGHLSTDAHGRELARILASEGVSLDLASSGPEPTTMAIARLDGDGVAEYDFIVDGTAAPNLIPAMLPASLGPEVDAIHVGALGLALEPIGSTLTALVRRESARRQVMLDPNVRPAASSSPGYRERLDSVTSLATILRASVEDLEWLYPGLDHRAAADHILEHGVRLVIVTLGAAGAFAATSEHRVYVEAPRVEVVDTIGAGDTFGAAVLAHLHDHGKLGPDLRLDSSYLEALLTYACRAASVTCTRPGADPPRKSELDLSIQSTAG